MLISMLKHIKSLKGTRWTAVQRTAPQGSPRTPATCIAATTTEPIVRILNSLFLNFVNF